jgi:hypothetical protein
MAFVAFLSRAAWCHFSGRDENRRYLGRMAVYCGFLHGLITLALLSVSRYPLLFVEDRLSFRGETVVLLGILASYGFLQISRYGSALSANRVLQAAASFAVSGHLFAFGASGWVILSSWNSGLPPISLISFAAAATASLLFLAKGSAPRPHSQSTPSERNHEYD